jgi:serine phosphatase RsbU (regulator of sigma subunit)/putative methionine-R-sulfoxide reductase with GAF domain
MPALPDIRLPATLLIGAVLALALLTFAGVIYLRRRRATRRALVARVAELQDLSEAVQAIASASLDETALCELVYQRAAKLMDARSFQLGFFDGSLYDLRIRVRHGERQPVRQVDIGDNGELIGWMRDTGKSILVRDFATELATLPAQPRSLDGDQFVMPRSGVFVPLLAGDQVVGAMGLLSDLPGAYSDSHLRILSIVANQAAAAVMNARALARERARARQLALVDTVARETASILDMDALLPKLANAIQRAFGYYFVGLFLIDERNGEIECRAATQPAELGLRRAAGVGLVGAAIGDARTLRIPDVSAEPRFLATPHLPNARSEAVVPLFLKDQVIGALDLQSDNTGMFSADDEAYLELLAQQVAVAVGDARLYEAEREQAWQSAAMLQVADVARSAETLEDAMEAIVRLSQMLSGVDACAILVRASPGPGFEIAAVEGQLSDHEHLAPGDEILVEDIPALARMMASRLPEAADMPGRLRLPAIALPMVARDELQAAMIVLSEGGHPSSTRRMDLLAGLASQAAVVLDAVRANVAREEEAWATAALLEVAQAVNEEKSVEVIVDRVVRLTPLMVGVDVCAVFVRDAETGACKLAGSAGVARSARDALLAMDGRTECWAAWLADPSILAAPALSQTPAPIAQALAIAHTAALPLTARGVLVGAMVVGARHAERMPRDRALSILHGIAQQSAMAIDGARLYQESLQAQRLEHELSLAREIQRSFLPRKLPAPEGWSIAADWQAARQVGGDFYDFIELQDGRFGVAVADVADKGVPAALFMALTRSLLRGAAFSGREPNAVLKRVNRLVLADTRSDLFVTMFYAILDTRSGETHYANAGHNLPMHARANGDLESLAGSGMAIGVIEPIEPPLREFFVAAGDALMLYTDGLVDALNADGEEFGMERLTSAFHAASPLSAAEIVDTVMTAVRDHTGGEVPFDDQTVVVIKRDTA